jgi:hypothetical protein
MMSHVHWCKRWYLAPSKQGRWWRRGVEGSLIAGMESLMIDLIVP